MASSEIVTDEDNLETLLAKATNPLHREPDAEAVAAFCCSIDKEHEGPQTSLRLLAHKIQSPIEKESLMALDVIEQCVRKCGMRFRTEVGKFRFLNEMIKVVSPKYLGNRASSKVKQKIVELMFIWSMELKNETKIYEAYQMLKRQGVVIEDPVYVLDNYEPPPPPPPRANKVPIFEDEENAQQLQRLLRSRNPEDLQAANRLIKNMVREADKRMELMAKRSTELETVHNNASVLADMLAHYRPGETSEEEQDLMKELFESCERLRPKLFRLAGELDEKDEGLSDILKANDELTIVINNYKKVMGLSSENGSSKTKEYSLLDLGSPDQENKTVKPSLLDDQLLALGIGDPIDKSSSTIPMPNKSNPDKSASNSVLSTDLADLDKVFTNSATNINTSFAPLKIGSKPLPNAVISNKYSADVLLSGNPTDTPSLTPVPSSSTVPVYSNAETCPSNSVSKGLEQLDELGQLLKKSLPGTTSGKFEFPSNTPQKVPLSQLIQQQKLQSKAESYTSNPLPPETNILSKTVSEKASPANSPAHNILSLNDVFVSLESVQPGDLSPLNLYEKNGLNVVIHFGKDSPRPDVTVMVVSTMSKNTSPVKNVSFQAAVPKSMKIKFQPPSATDLPPHNPILPPAAITQVILLANPNKENVRLKYKINYSLNNQDFTDTGEVDSLLAPR